LTSRRASRIIGRFKMIGRGYNACRQGLVIGVTDAVA